MFCFVLLGSCSSFSCFFFFFFNDTATTEIYTLSLHDALPIFCGYQFRHAELVIGAPQHRRQRSEEHTSELQSHVNIVCRLLLEKKKKHDSCHQRESKNKEQQLEFHSVSPQVCRDTPGFQCSNPCPGRLSFPPFFFFNDTATTEIYTLSLHDALPISRMPPLRWPRRSPPAPRRRTASGRSEEHTSELQSHVNLVCRLLLEKKKHI